MKHVITSPFSKTEAQAMIRESSQRFPFASTLSLLPLIRYWQEAIEPGNEIDGLLALRVMEQLRAAPALWEPIQDTSILHAYKEEIELLMTAVFPPALYQDCIGAAIAPYRFQHIFATPSYRELFSTHGTSMLDTYMVDQHTLVQNKILFACSLILDKWYGVNVMKETSLLFYIPDPQTGLDRYFKSHINTRFAEIVKGPKDRKLSEKTIKSLLYNLEDKDLWLRTFPPDQFAFEGLVLLNLIDVTEEALLSSLRHDLLAKEAFITPENKHQIQHKLRSLFKAPDLKVGLRVCEDEESQSYAHVKGLWNCVTGCIDNKGFCKHSVYEKVREGRRAVIFEDLSEHTTGEADPAAAQLVSHGIRSLILAPLVYENQVIGVLELGSGTPGALTAISALRLNELLPLLSLAVQRSLDEINNRIEAIIKEKYADIHPTVAWRFHQAAQNLLEAQRRGESSEVERIVFKKVHPLYGFSDIRGSSEARNASVQIDLIQQLSLAQQVLSEAMTQHTLPLLETLNHRIQQHKIGLEQALNSGDEMNIVEFIRQEVDPTFQHLHESFPLLKKLVDMYRGALDKELGLVYKRRKGYEESVNAINHALADFLDQKEREAQAIFPHYFSKNLTDGVAYDIYVGESMVAKQRFHKMHLKNLRLWQLQTTCEMARLAAQLKPRLPIALDLVHLIFVYNTTINIRFRLDEKRFDVDGAYNIQYEIIKKRLDKAMVKDTDERLTQPGTLSIVYAHPRDAEEYRGYLFYLQDRGYLSPEVEELEIDPLPGVKGLKALRVKINLYTGISEPMPMEGTEG